MKKSDASSIRKAIAGAVAMIAASIGLVLARKLGTIDGETVNRLFGVIIGIVFVVGGNTLPKERCDPKVAADCGPTREQSLRRFAGWFIVLSGLAYAGVWLFMPAAHAKTVSLVIVVAIFLLYVRLLWPVISRKLA